MHLGSEKTTEKTTVSSERTTSSLERNEKVNQAIRTAIKKNPKVSKAEIDMLLGLSSRAIEKQLMGPVTASSLIRGEGYRIDELTGAMSYTLIFKSRRTYVLMCL